MFGETPITHVKIWKHHPLETIIYKWMVQFPGSRKTGFQASNSSHLITFRYLRCCQFHILQCLRGIVLVLVQHDAQGRVIGITPGWTQLGKNQKQLRYKCKINTKIHPVSLNLLRSWWGDFDKLWISESVPQQTPQRWGTPTVPHPRPCYLLLNVYSHRIHGTGIFTYMKGWFLW